MMSNEKKKKKKVNAGSQILSIFFFSILNSIVIDSFSSVTRAGLFIQTSYYWIVLQYR